ncbi:MAG TPA: hypothetical protein VHD35_12925 [Chitinophagaceae bacterium]|nr:hypothetical protein [Chitinophagaceae bacterium]
MQFKYPETLTGQELDSYLANGWFRMQHYIFRSDNSGGQSVKWIRLVVKKFEESKSAKKISGNNNLFSYDLETMKIDDEIEELYAEYRGYVKFGDDIFKRVKEMLGAERKNIFDTYCIKLRDDKKLIGVGVFDMGYASIAAISNFYHPSYHKKSVGKYLMLLEIKEAVKLRKYFFYPGYVFDESPLFDYKFFPSNKNAFEYFDYQNLEWEPAVRYIKKKSPILR